MAGIRSDLIMGTIVPDERARGSQRTAREAPVLLAEKRLPRGAGATAGARKRPELWGPIEVSETVLRSTPFDRLA